MSLSLALTSPPQSAKQIFSSVAVAITLTFLTTTVIAVPIVNLGTAQGFAILAGSQITDAGGASTIVTGDVGLYPATGAAIGLNSSQVLGGTIYQAQTSGALLNGAQNDLTAAYVDAAGRSASVDFGVVDNQLGGKTLFPGVYSFGNAATANLIGTLTLDANGDANPVWIFQATSDLVTAAGAPGSAGSTVLLVNGADACDVFWQVGSSATIGNYANFVGTIMADQSISLKSYATLNGRAFARIAAVTLDNNTITAENCAGATNDGGSRTVPDAAGTLLLMGPAFGALVLLRRTGKFRR